MDFASAKNQIIDFESNGYGTEIEDIVETIETQTLMDPILLSNHFWNVFVIDALIGNWDRHNGNWGFLYNQDTDDIKLAPIFDCGSCLFPQMDDEVASKVLNDKGQMNARIFDFPTSAISKNGRRINYYQFIQSHEYKECDDAAKRLKEKMDINKIINLIDSVDCLKPHYKEFLKVVIRKRLDSFFA